MKALIVGSTGYIGTALARSLSEANCDVISSQRIDPTAAYFLELSQGFNKQVFEGVQVNVVFVLAAVSNTKQCQQSPEMAAKVNVASTCQLIQYFHDQGSFIVYLSSNHVFANESVDHQVTQALEPRTTYGQHKAAVEQYITQQKINAAIVRPTKVIGKDFPLFDQWLDSWQQGQSIEAFDDHYIAPVSLTNFVMFLIRVMSTPIAGVYHCSGETSLSYVDVAKTLFKHWQHANNLSAQAENPLQHQGCFVQHCHAQDVGVVADKKSLLSTQGQVFPYQADILDDVLTEYIRGRFA